MQRAHEVLYYVGLGEARYRNLETYSTGMKQRIKLAQALVHDPDLLFLDEPTNGMDPKGRDEMLELIRDLAHNKGVNLILSSHLLPDVEFTCDHVVVVDKGAVATAGPIKALKGPRGRVYELRVKGDQAGFIAVLRGEGLDCHDTDEDVMRVFVPEAATVNAGQPRPGRGATDADPARAALPAGGPRARAGAAPAAQRADARGRVRPRRGRGLMPCRSTIRAIVATRGTRAAVGTRLAGDRRRRHPHRRQQARVHRADAVRLGAVRRPRRADLRLRQFPAGVVPGAEGRDLPRVPRAAGHLRLLRHHLRRRRAHRQRPPRQRAAAVPLQAAHAPRSTSPASWRSSSCS